MGINPQKWSFCHYLPNALFDFDEIWSKVALYYICMLLHYGAFFHVNISKKLKDNSGKITIAMILFSYNKKKM
jgi:hypothetical protein